MLLFREENFWLLVVDELQYVSLTKSLPNDIWKLHSEHYLLSFHVLIYIDDKGFYFRKYHVCTLSTILNHKLDIVNLYLWIFSFVSYCNYNSNIFIFIKKKQF